ncbi:MAG: PIN domain-containing protein [bacterium]
MRAVIDTNVFIESLSRSSPYQAIFQKLVDGGFSICVSTSILLEYEE